MHQSHGSMCFLNPYIQYIFQKANYGKKKKKKQKRQTHKNEREKWDEKKKPHLDERQIVSPPGNYWESGEQFGGLKWL